MDAYLLPGWPSLCSSHLPLLPFFPVKLRNSSRKWRPRRKLCRASMFPGGRRRAELKLPGLAVRVRAEDLVDGKTTGFLGILDLAVAGGLNMVILEAGNELNTSGGRLYDSACLVKMLLRGRAALLVAERVDIATAAGVDGVILSDQGLSALVARNMMRNAIPQAAALPLVARSVTSFEKALSASDKEGADFLLIHLGSNNMDARNIVDSVCKRVTVPVFVEVSSTSHSASSVMSNCLELLGVGANGLVLDILDLKSNGAPSRYVATLISTIQLAIQQRKTEEDISISSALLPTNIEDGVGCPTDNLGSEETSAVRAEKIIAKERLLLSSAFNVIQKAAPQLGEISLLVSAITQLDEPFLLVIAGEFNSGKSSVINAFLGDSFLREGVLPTTNEITLIRYRGDKLSETQSERHQDGHFIRYLPAELLKQMNLVDTPGTNVILQRQQRLTEEFVPRADLILFVLSADRPLTDSEVTFLRYIKRWQKKVVFILNKADIIDKPRELEEIVEFVKENASQLLSIQEPLVFPVSARRALQAKHAAKNANGENNVSHWKRSELWESSGFQDLETYIFNFIDGSSAAGAERLRLKLDTPVSVALALIGACKLQLASKSTKLRQDLDAVLEMTSQLEQYELACQRDASIYQKQVIELIEVCKERADKYIDRILKLSNFNTISHYIMGGELVNRKDNNIFTNEVFGTTYLDLQGQLQKYHIWLESSRVKNYEMLESKWKAIYAGILSGVLEPAVVDEDRLHDPKGDNGGSLGIVQGFDIQAATILFNQEAREVIMGIFGGLGAAGITASLLTSVLPTTLEDILALGLCTAGGYLGILALPARREEVKRKVRKTADSLAQKIRDAMEAELQYALNINRDKIKSLLEPCYSSIEVSLKQLDSLQGDVHIIEDQLQQLKQKIQALD